MKHSPRLTQLIDALRALPGVGPKTAQRMAFHLLQEGRSGARALASALDGALESVVRCGRCRMLTEEPLCSTCSATHRDSSLLCVVESALDVLAVERTSEFGGLYFVLHGVISPIDGIGPEQIHVPQLLDRVRDDGVVEVIIALNADIEGEATAVYLQHALQPLGATVTRPAHGLPVGGDLEYADELTLARAMAGRRTF